jgi:hypothetical protein
VWRNTDDVPELEFADLIIESDATGAGHDDIGLLLLAMPLT